MFTITYGTRGCAVINQAASWYCFGCQNVVGLPPPHLPPQKERNFLSLRRNYCAIFDRQLIYEICLNYHRLVHC